MDANIPAGAAAAPRQGSAGTACRAMTRSNAATTAGSNWVPAQRRSSASASASVSVAPVAALGAHGVEGVGDEDDARAERDVRGREPVRVARAVHALVARADEPRAALERRGGGEDALADDGVAADQRPLGVRQRAALLQDRLRDRHLADVVERGRVAQRLELAAGQAELGGDRAGELAAPRRRATRAPARARRRPPSGRPPTAARPAGGRRSSGRTSARRRARGRRRRRVPRPAAARRRGRP